MERERREEGRGEGDCVSNVITVQHICDHYSSIHKSCHCIAVQCEH